MDEFPKLVNSHDDSTITINNSSFSIGRSLSCDHIIQSLGVSRFHCIIKKNDEKWTLFDRSTNGTMVNSTLYKFNESVDLRNGDVIKLGPENLDFIFTDSEQIQRSKNNITDEDNRREVDEVDAIASALFPNDEVLLEEAASLLAEGLEEPNEITHSPVEPTAKSEKMPINENKNKNETTQSFDVMESELTCSICSELFIKAVTLNCSHTFCKFCIEQWKKNKSSCPICRKYITTVAPTLVLDNFIEKIISTQGDEVKETRKVLVQQREELVVNTASGSSNSATSTTAEMVEGGSVIEIFSEDDDEDEEDSDYNYFSDDHDYDVYDCYFDSRPYVGSRGRSYGGYGRCFICSQPGHWANSCPFKRR